MKNTEAVQGRVNQDTKRRLTNAWETLDRSESWAVRECVKAHLPILEQQAAAYAASKKKTWRHNDKTTI